MEKFYITTSIPYASAGPHVGHILDPLIADVLARYHRDVKNEEVKFLVGTDEHGIKIVRTAEAQNKTPKQLVDENSAKYRALKETLNLSYTDFIRTTDREKHWPGVIKMWNLLLEAGKIEKRKYRGLYCVGHESFVTEKDLVNGICPDHQKAPEVIEEENWFFKLSDHSKQIAEALESGKMQVVPESRKNEILSLIKEGLEDVSFSRPKKDLSWGVPVPNDSEQTMYVWCDALVNYISAIGYGRDDNEVSKWWPADIQVIGKDNLRFHAAIWPGMLLAAGLKLPKIIFVHGFVNVDGKKISKTVGNVILPEEIVKKYGTDATRYYFLREFPATNDGDFSFEKFEERYNGELANGLGNLVARVLTLASKTNLEIKASDLKEYRNGNTISATRIEISKLMNEFKFNEVLARIWLLITLADGMVTQEKVWENTDSKKEIMEHLIFSVKNIAQMIFPFMPATSEKILKSIDDSGDVVKITKPENLFPRI